MFLLDSKRLWWSSTQEFQMPYSMSNAKDKMYFLINLYKKYRKWIIKVEKCMW